MTEKGKAFFAEVSKNEELKARLFQIDRRDMKTAIPQAIELAKAYGFELTAADLVTEKPSAAEGQMADDELNAVAGGVGDITTECIFVDQPPVVCCASLYGAPGSDYCEKGVINFEPDTPVASNW